MKRFLLLLLFIILPNQLFAEDNLSQSLWAEIVGEETEKPEGKVEPMLSGRFVLDVNSDNNYNATDSRQEYADSRATGYLTSKLKLSNNLSVKSNLRFERVNKVSQDDARASSADGGGDMAFDDQGINVKELILNYERNNLSLMAGKFIANFGNAWKSGRGIWTRDLNMAYIQQDKLGLGASYKRGNLQKIGLYDFGFSAFTNDRKNMDNSILSKRDSDHKYDGMPGDTRSLESYVASLDVSFRFEQKEELFYHFAYLNLAANEKTTLVDQAKVEDQKGFVANGKYRYPMGENFLLDSFLEYVDMKNVGGDSDVGTKFVNASFVGEIYRNWNITLAGTHVQNKVIEENGYDQNFMEVSAGYKFDKTAIFDNFLIQIGYKNTRTDFKTSVTEQQSYGVLARYIKAF